MKIRFTLLLSVILSLNCKAQTNIFEGSTSAHAFIREFLQISAVDSIDFIRWKLETATSTYKLVCQYGLSKANTSGFIDGKTVSFEGILTKSKNVYVLSHSGKNVSLLEVNNNVLHFIDRKYKFLPGNGGYSYALNTTKPTATDVINLSPVTAKTSGSMVFEGRTPCSHLKTQLGINKGDECIKLKWYFILHVDSLSGKPAYFHMAGLGYWKKAMAKGRWEVVTTSTGQTVYKLHFEKWSSPLLLLKGDENVLFFTDATGRLLVGNQDFSYTLNRVID